MSHSYIFLLRFRDVGLLAAERHDWRRYRDHVDKVAQRFLYFDDGCQYIS